MSGNLYLNIDFGNSPSTDTGARPYTGSTPIWENASIWLKSADATALPSQTQTVVGHDTEIRVRVSNNNPDPNAKVSNVQVDAYVMNPFVGLASPALALDAMTFTGFVSSVASGSGNPTETDPHVVTCLVNGNSPWTPSTGDFTANQNDHGHLCVIANAYSIGGGDGAAVPISGTFDVVNDQHQGQRNIALLAAPPGPQRISQVNFAAITPPNGAETTLTVEPVPAGYTLGQGEHWLLQSHHDISFVPVTEGGPPTLVVARHGDVGPVPLGFSQRGLNAVLTVAGRPLGARAPLAADEPAVMASVSVDLSEEDIGAMHVFDIVQRDGDGRALGGLRVLGVVR